MEETYSHEVLPDARILSAFIIVWCDQTEWQSPLVNLKYLVACFVVLARHSAMVEVLLRKSCHPLLQVSVVGVDGDPAFGFIKNDFRDIPQLLN